jgi:hypothetical protein
LWTGSRCRTAPPRRIKARCLWCIEKQRYRLKLSPLSQFRGRRGMPCPSGTHPAGAGAVGPCNCLPRRPGPAVLASKIGVRVIGLLPASLPCLPCFPCHVMLCHLHALLPVACLIGCCLGSGFGCGLGRRPRLVLGTACRCYRGLSDGLWHMAPLPLPVVPNSSSSATEPTTILQYEPACTSATLALYWVWELSHIFSATNKTHDPHHLLCLLQAQSAPSAPSLTWTTSWFVIAYLIKWWWCLVALKNTGLGA